MIELLLALRFLFEAIGCFILGGVVGLLITSSIDLGVLAYNFIGKKRNHARKQISE